MTTYRTARISFSLWFLLLALVLASCDTAAPPEDPRLTLRFVQSREADGQVAEVKELGSFDVPLPEPLPRPTVFTQKFALEGYDAGRFGARRSGLASDLKGDMIFWFVTDDGTGAVVASGVQDFLDPSKPLPFDDAPAGKNADVFEGTLHAFSVEGVGEPSTAPIELLLHGATEERTFEYEPEQHVLNARFALHVDDGMLRPFLPETEGGLFKIELKAQNVDLDEHLFILARSEYVPAYGTVNGKPVEGKAKMWSGLSFSDRRRLSGETLNSRSFVEQGIPESPEFYLVALSGW